MIVMTAGLSLGCAGTAAVAATVAPSSTVSQSASPPVAATSAPATGALTVGAPLSAALEHLRAAGLQLVYSSALVAPDLRVKSDPGSGTAAELAARLLAPHGLALDLVGPGVYVVVRATVLALPGASASSAAPAVREAPADAPLEQVSVYASRYRVDPAQGLALVDLTRTEIEALPGLDEDVLRVMRYLPGTATNGVSARANVRGGRDNELAVYFDGVPLFEPFHFKDYQGLLGVLDPGAISRLDFFSGVFPARYGDRLSGVLDLAPRRPEAGADHHELGLSLLYAHGMSVGERDWRGRPLEWLLSLRQSTAELALKAAGRGSVDPDFLDGLGRVAVRVGERSQLSAGVLRLDDTLVASVADSREKTQSRYLDGTGWIGFETLTAEGLALTARAAFSERHTERNGSLAQVGRVVGAVDDDREFSSTTLRFEARGARGWTLGLEAADIGAHFDYAAQASFDPLLAAVFGRPASFTRDTLLDAGGRAYAAYGSWLWQPGSRWRLDLGLRLDVQRYSLDGRAAAAPGGRFDDEQWSPRLALEYQWDDDTVLRAGAGRTTQSERPDELMVADGEPRFHAAQRATQLVLGIERRLAPRTSLRLEAYRKSIADPAPRYENLLDPVVILPELEVDRARVAPGSSLAYGAEMTLRWQAPRDWAAWLTYSRSEATDYVDGIEVPRSWNQLNSLNGGLSWTRNPWQLSANLTWHDGWRRSALDSIPNPVAPAGGEVLRLAPRNAAAWDPFLSLDLRATWIRPLPRGALRLYAEVNNATDHANECCESVSVQRAAGADPFLQRRERAWLPRYALVGVTWELP